MNQNAIKFKILGSQSVKEFLEEKLKEILKKYWNDLWSKEIVRKLVFIGCRAQYDSIETSDSPLNAADRT